MAYIAKKAVKFDRNYSIGETVPDAVIDPRRASRLVEMGLIAEEKAPLKAQEPAGGQEAPLDTRGHDTEENAAETPQEAAEATSVKKRTRSKK